MADATVRLLSIICHHDDRGRPEMIGKWQMCPFSRRQGGCGELQVSCQQGDGENYPGRHFHTHEGQEGDLE